MHTIERSSQAEVLVVVGTNEAIIAPHPVLSGVAVGGGGIGGVADRDLHLHGRYVVVHADIVHDGEGDEWHLGVCIVDPAGLVSQRREGRRRGESKEREKRMKGYSSLIHPGCLLGATKISRRSTFSLTPFQLFCLVSFHFWVISKCW